MPLADSKSAAYTSRQADPDARGSEGAGNSTSEAAGHQVAYRSEVEVLRAEIEQMKAERAALGEEPPSYEEELRFANAIAMQHFS